MRTALFAILTAILLAGCSVHIGPYGEDIKWPSYSLRVKEFRNNSGVSIEQQAIEQTVIDFFTSYSISQGSPEPDFQLRFDLTSIRSGSVSETLMDDLVSQRITVTAVITVYDRTGQQVYSAPHSALEYAERKSAIGPNTVIRSDAIQTTINRILRDFLYEFERYRQDIHSR